MTAHNLSPFLFFQRRTSFLFTLSDFVTNNACVIKLDFDIDNQSRMLQHLTTESLPLPPSTIFLWRRRHHNLRVPRKGHVVLQSYLAKRLVCVELSTTSVSVKIDLNPHDTSHSIVVWRTLLRLWWLVWNLLMSRKRVLWFRARCKWLSICGWDLEQRFAFRASSWAHLW